MAHHHLTAQLQLEETECVPWKSWAKTVTVSPAFTSAGTTRMESSSSKISTSDPEPRPSAVGYADIVDLAGLEGGHGYRDGYGRSVVASERMVAVPMEVPLSTTTSQPFAPSSNPGRQACQTQCLYYWFSLVRAQTGVHLDSNGLAAFTSSSSLRIPPAAYSSSVRSPANPTIGRRLGMANV